jgi:hypothetical protein
MSVNEFMQKHTTENPAACASVAQLRRQYEQETGQPIARAIFVGHLLAAGFAVATSCRRQLVVVGRSLGQRRYVVENGKAVLVAA